jgi:Fic family protein
MAGEGEGGSHRWSPITGLPADPSSLAVKELHALRNVWREQRVELDKTGLVTEFLRRLNREYAIEGGIIERAYTLDRGITEILIERGIDASLIPHNKTDRDPLYVARNIQAHEGAIETIFEWVKQDRPLLSSGIKALHAALMSEEETVTKINPNTNLLFETTLLKGEYKRMENQPRRPDGRIHEYCPAIHVQSEMDNLLKWHAQHMRSGIPAEVEAAWLHHRFAQIHPFEDGNGRIARLLATYVFLKDGYFPLALVDREDREPYIAALEQADAGDLSPLIHFFSRVQRRSFVKALSLAGEVRREGSVEQSIAAAREQLVARKSHRTEELEKAKQLASRLHAFAGQRLQQVAERLNTELHSVSSHYFSRVESATNQGEKRHWFHHQVIDSAKSLHYFANPGSYHDWTRLTISTGEDQTEILVSFHGLGQEDRGVIAAAVCVFRRLPSEGGERQATEATPVGATPFQVNYLDDAGEAEQRFTTWLNISLTQALDIWRATL